MSSWVRYSVTVYIGLLISGALAREPWQAPAPYEPITPSAAHDPAPAQDNLKSAPRPQHKA